MILLRWNKEWTQWEAVDVKDNSYIPVNMPSPDMISQLQINSSEDECKVFIDLPFKSTVIRIFRNKGIIDYTYEVPLV